MGSLSTGGGSSAVAASAHAGCERFRLTDPLITNRSRRNLAAAIGHPDVSGGIPEARWMRAITFERLVHSPRFVSELLTKAVGQLGLPRPSAVRRRNCKVSVATTASELARAHKAALDKKEATMLVALAVPFMHLEDHPDATPVKPDFAIVCPRQDAARRTVGSWLIMGDAKDYERVRARIDDTRLLKGFLQVALGAESALAWSKLPSGMYVHEWGALAVPRNAFLQPEAIVEHLDDHRTEVRDRAADRLQATALSGQGSLTRDELTSYVTGLEAEFDPQTCATCNMFTFCRDQLRASTDPTALLVELGIDKSLRPAVRGMVDGSGGFGVAPTEVVAAIDATLNGLPGWANRRRTDPVGRPGTINVILSKSDSAALGVYGIAVQPVTKSGPGRWQRLCFDVPQSSQTRQAIMKLLGKAIKDSIDGDDTAIHLVVPDIPTADLLVSIADSLAGVELSRLRWQRDLEKGRPALTFDGTPATLPEPLDDSDRVAVSFLLEADRARALTLRSPIVDLGGVLATHVIAGGPAVDRGRLDYLVTWAEAAKPLDHRDVSDRITAERHTPGARLSNVESDAIHAAQRKRVGALAAYRKLVAASLDYKADIIERAVAILGQLDHSRLFPAYEALEGDAQHVWRRRLELRASDLVRFSRTNRRWRNDHVLMLDADAKCASQLTALADPLYAWDLALDAGNRKLATAVVHSVNPIRLEIDSRSVASAAAVVLLHVNDEPVVESLTTTLKIQKGSFKLGHFSIGPIGGGSRRGPSRWSPTEVPALKKGDELVVADADWFDTFATGHEIAIRRPSIDTNLAPRPGCGPDSYVQDPDRHQWCCRPHESSEAEWADILGGRRARGELNPETWPPLVDEERFDVGAAALEGPDLQIADPVPVNLTLDDVE
jgi:hypothetical protein